MKSKRVTVTLDSDIEDWLIGRANDRHSMSERIRICLREYMLMNPRRFVSEKAVGGSRCTPIHTGGVDDDLVQAWQKND